MQINLQKTSFFTINTTIALALALTGCGHENPLATQTTEQSGEFLFKASQSAEKALGQLVPPGGGKYGQCMNGSKKDESFCNNLYEKMIVYARQNTESDSAEFENINLSDLTDKKVFYLVQDEYHNKVFTAI